MAVTSNMGIPIDVVSVTPGPSWAVDLELSKNIIDAHTHVSGAGVPVPTAGLNINASIPMGGFGLSNAGLMGLGNQLTTSSGSVNFLYAFGGNLYWNQGSGVPIQLTTTTGINVSGIGGITGLAGTTGAWTYSAALTTFIGTADTGKSAAVDAGALTIRETNVLNANGVRFKSPSGLAAGYDLTLPPSLPSITTSSGVWMASNAGAMGVGRINDFGFYVYSTRSKTGIASQTFATMYGDNVVKDTASAYSTSQAIYTIPANGDWLFGWNVPGQVTTGSGGFLQSALIVNSGAGGLSSAYGASAKIYAGGSQGDGGRSFGLPGTFVYMNARVGDRIKVGLHWDENGSHTAGQTASMTLASGYNYFYGVLLRQG